VAVDDDTGLCPLFGPKSHFGGLGGSEILL